MDFNCDPEIGKQCKNNALCHLCDGERLLKLPVKKTFRTGPKKKKEGMDFEKKVAKKWNKSTNKNLAVRQPNSGAIRDRPGDITTPTDLMECKERGTITSKGEKTISISLSWILKVQREMISAGKQHWYIPFGFKHHEDIYVVKSLDHELELLQEIEVLNNKIAELEAKLDEK